MKALDTLRLKVRARNIQPRLRPSLNREFAALVLKNSEEPAVCQTEETKLAGAVPRRIGPWFDFKLQLKLTQPLLQAAIRWSWASISALGLMPPYQQRVGMVFQRVSAVVS